MISIRQATSDDLLSIQHSNLLCLPENYMQKYFMFHLMSWPDLSFVAVESSKNRVIGYVLAKMDEDNPKNPPHGHITSLAVERKFRRRGIAQRLMELTCQAMIMSQNSRHCSLHVRASNRAAFALYTSVLKFEMVDREEGYYADGEDGLLMRKDLVKHSIQYGIKPAHSDCFYDNHQDREDAAAKILSENIQKMSISDESTQPNGSTAEGGQLQQIIRTSVENKKKRLLAQKQQNQSELDSGGNANNDNKSSKPTKKLQASKSNSDSSKGINTN